MIQIKTTSNIGEITDWIKNFKIRRQTIKRWAIGVHRRERREAQRAIKQRGRGSIHWQTPLFRTGFLYSRVNYSYRVDSLVNNHQLTVETPVFYANYLADRWPYLAMTEEDVTVHTNALAALIFDNRKIL